MARRRIGQECFGFGGVKAGRRSSLDELTRLIDWTEIDRLLGGIYAAEKGEQGWPPLALFRALLLAVWYDLSDVRLAEALDDRASFRRFCGFAAREPTPERTAFVRFRRELVARGLDAALFEAVTRQLIAKGIRVKKGTLVDATVIASASLRDDEAAWSGHRRRRPVHGYKAHVGADADTAIVEAVAVTPGSVHELSQAASVLPEAPGEVYADSAYRGDVFAGAVRAKGGRPRVAQTGTWGGPEALARLEAWNAGIQRVRCRIEKIFGTWKRSYGLRRMRWRGLAKAGLQVRLTALAYNLKRTAAILRPVTA